MCSQFAYKPKQEANALYSSKLLRFLLWQYRSMPQLDISCPSSRGQNISFHIIHKHCIPAQQGQKLRIRFPINYQKPIKPVKHTNHLSAEIPVSCIAKIPLLNLRSLVYFQIGFQFFE